MSYIKCATVKLQSKETDIAKAYSLIHVLLTIVQGARENVNMKSLIWFERAKTLGKEVNTTACKPRTCSKQTLSANPEIQDPEEYYRIALIIPFLDHILSELDSRFDPDSFDAIKGFSVIPLVVL